MPGCILPAADRARCATGARTPAACRTGGPLAAQAHAEPAAAGADRGPPRQVFREWRALRSRPGGPAEEAGGLAVCDGHRLSVADGAVRLEGPGSAAFFERAEEVEDCKARSADACAQLEDQWWVTVRSGLNAPGWPRGDRAEPR